MDADLSALTDDLERWLANTALPVWWERGGDRVHGGFFEFLGQDGAPLAGPKRCYPQTRQIYVYAQAGLRGWDGPWRQAVEHGLAFFLSAFPRPDGLVRMRVTADGAPDDERPRLYDQAFALLALATAYRALPARTDLAVVAVRLRDRLLADRRHPAGGFTEVVASAFYANPNMHLLEAVLAWEAVSDDPAWRAMSDEIADLALSQFIDPAGGFLREHFDASWSPAAGDDGRLVEPGHQFEWAWLLDRWGRARGRPEADAAAARLYAHGLSGIDRGRGVAINALWDDFSVRDAGARLWPQTEWIKASVARARQSGPGTADRTQALAQTAAAVKGLTLYLDTPVAGLWRDRLGADGVFANQPAPATSFYHIVCAINELGALR